MECEEKKISSLYNWVVQVKVFEKIHLNYLAELIESVRISRTQFSDKNYCPMQNPCENSQAVTKPHHIKNTAHNTNFFCVKKHVIKRNNVANHGSSQTEETLQQE